MRIQQILLSLILAASAADAQTYSDATTPPPQAELPGAPVEGSPPRMERESRLLLPDTELIDVPTAAVLDLGGFYSRTRFFSQGGILQHLAFGVYPRVNIGASANIDRMIGTDGPTQLARPELQLKFRFFDGDRLIPAIALGFDGQGWLYNRRDKAYNQKQRGLYFIGSQELAIPGLHAHAGFAISDFDSNDIGGILAANYNIQDRMNLMLEWDNINDFVESRLNAGMRFYVTPAFNFEFSIRSIGQGGSYPNGIERGNERVAQFKYTGNF